MLGIFDSERAAKTSGSRFVYLTGPGVILELALVRFAIDFLSERGFTPVVPPVLVRRHAMHGTGFFPADEHEFYAVDNGELFLTGTSEVALAAMHSDEILDGDALPFATTGFLPCFRREAGSYGKDTKGLIRVHQFDKVEQFSFARRTTRGTSTQPSGRTRRRSSGARDPVSRARHVRRRPRGDRPRRGRQRGVAPGAQRYSSSPRPRTRPTTRPAACRFASVARPGRAWSHVERPLRRGPHDRRLDREPPASRRQRRDPGRAEALHGIRGAPPAPLIGRFAAPP